MANYELSNLKYKGNTYIIKDNSALHQDSIGSWMPDFSNFKPISTHEFDISSTSYYKICERANVAAIKDIADEVLAFRITITGTSIFAVADVLVRLQPTVNVRPLVMVNYQTQSTSAATTGIRYLRTVNPKAVNTSYKYEIAIAAYNATSRHIKVEIFKAPSTWAFASAATVYSYNSTYQTASDLTLYTSIGTFYNYTWYGTASFANYAGYKAAWDALFNSQGNYLAAGAAIAANQFIFIGKDSKVYPTTSTSVEIDPAWPIMYCTEAYNANASVGWAAIRTWGYFTPASSISKDGTLVADDTVYMRCTCTNSKLYSANTMTQNLTAGNTYIKLGKMYSATAVSVNTYNSEYFTLDTYGSLTVLKALNGYLFNAAKADTASTVSKAGSTAAGTYGVLFDNNPITSVVPANTSPRVNNQLTFDPSTGNLTSGIFTGSGAGLTNVPIDELSEEAEKTANKTTAISSTSTNDQYPSAKAVYDNAPAVYYGTCSTAAVTTTKVIDGVPTNAKIQEGTMLHVSFNPVTTIGYGQNATLSVNSTNYDVRTYTDYAYGYGGSTAYAGAALNNREDVDFVFKTINNVLYAVALDVKAVVLKNIWPVAYRVQNLNNMTYPINGLTYALATVALSTANGKPYFNGEARDSYVLALHWDNARAYGAQLAIANGSSAAQGGIAYRRQKGTANVTATGWYDWKTVLDEDNVEKYVSEKTDATFAYTASGLAFSNHSLTVPIDGTKYKILQMTVFNKDLSFGLGFPRLFIFDAAGALGYIEGTSTYCTTTSAASGITVAFDSSWEPSASTNVEIVVLYRRIS